MNNIGDIDMPEISRVYLLTGGEYSDYRVYAAFSTEVAANRAKAFGIGDEVECFQLDPEIIPPPEGLEVWHVSLDHDGNILTIPNGTSEPYRYPPWRGGRYDLATLARAEIYSHENGDQFSVTCWARDEEHALKVANEMRVQHIAQEAVPCK